MGNILGEIRILPRGLSVGSVKKGDTALNKIIISGENKAFQIIKVACDLPFVEVSLSSIDKEKKYEVSARLSGSSPSGPFTGQIDIFTDHPDEKILHIPVYGTIQK